MKTLWKQSLKVRLQFTPRSVQDATKRSRHMSRVLVMRLLRVIGECRSRSAFCPRRDVVRGWQHRDRFVLLVAPRSEKIGEHGRRKRRLLDDECTRTKMLAGLTVVGLSRHPSSIWPEQSMWQATWREQAHGARRTSRSATCAGHCQWHWKRTARFFVHFCTCFKIVVLVQFRRTPSKSSAPCQDTDNPDDAQRESIWVQLVLNTSM